MSEESLRRLQRRWRASGDPADHQRLLHELRRLRRHPASLKLRLNYFGKTLAGKTTNFVRLHELLQDRDQLEVDELLSTAHEGDRTLVFALRGFLFESTPLTVELVTNPGSVYFEETYRQGLKNAGGVAFIVSSQDNTLDWSLERQGRLSDHLRSWGLDPASHPLVFQWNKRDLANAVPLDELERAFNPAGLPSFPAIAVLGEGVFETFLALLRLTLDRALSPFGLDPVNEEDARRFLGEDRS